MSDTGYGGPERRKHPRYNVHLLIHVAELGQLRGVVTQDLSQGGMFIETSSPLKPGSLLPLTLIHPHTGDELPLITEVVRLVKDPNGHQRGIGLRFHQPDAALIRRLERMLEDLGPAPPRPPQQVPPNPQMAQPETPELREIPPEVLQDGNDIPLNAVPELLAMTQSLPPMLLHLIMHINGRDNVEEIMRRSGLHVAETRKGLKELLDAKVIKLPGLKTTLRSTQTPPADELRPELREKAGQFAAERAQDYMQQAADAYDQGKLPEAIRLLQLSLALRPPNTAEIHKRLARIAYQDLLDFELAKTHAISALALNPEQPELHKMIQDIRALEVGNVGVKTRETQVDDD